ncbi:MAG TPA: arylesterase [Fibrobacteria bacterium]|nr:arylesterase [Fibrobacteria bacterium]
MNHNPGRKALLFILLFVLSAALLGWSAESGAFRILILGDSLTEGYGVEKEDAFPARLQTRIREEGWGSRIEVVNGGSSGSTSASGGRRLKWYGKTRPDLVILALGSNDGLRGVKVEETRRNIEAAIAFCEEKGWKVALTGLEVPPNYGAKYAGEFRGIFPELAKKHGLPLHAFLLEGVAGEAEMNIADGIHPNERGHARIAENLLAFLKPMLPSKGG